MRDLERRWVEHTVMREILTKSNLDDQIARMFNADGWFRGDTFGYIHFNVYGLNAPNPDELFTDMITKRDYSAPPDYADSPLCPDDDEDSWPQINADGRTGPRWCPSGGEGVQRLWEPARFA